LARKLLRLTLIMQQKPANNVISRGNQGIPRLSPSRGTRKSRQPLQVVRAPRESLATERLEAAGRLAGWLAHQINNPLGAISGNTQLLARRLQRDIGDPDALRAYLRHLEAIQSQIERCTRITAEVLSFTRPGEPDLRKTDVLEVIAEAVELVRYVHPDSRIAFDPGNSAELPEVRADGEWLARVMFEVLSNAAQACPKGPVTIEVEAVPDRRGRSSGVRIRVSDSGPGIADDVLPRIFDPFFSTRDKARGLGLTLSLEMMRKMGGALEVERSNSRGCVFTIGIPVWGRQN